VPQELDMPHFTLKARVCKKREHIEDSVKNGEEVDAPFQAEVSLLPG